MQPMVVDAPQTPASERVWHTPELVILILPHLVRERIDLIAVSQLSTFHRALALPFLIRTLDIALSKLDAYEGLFRCSPELARYVRFVRIIDDTTATKFLHRDHSRPTKAITSSSGISHLRKGRHQPKIPYMDTAHQWLRLKDIIDSTWTEARFDITAGVSSSWAIHEEIPALGMEGKTAAMRWIADQTRDDDEEEDQPGEQIEREERGDRRRKYALDWDGVLAVNTHLMDAQKRTSASPVSLQINERQTDILGRSMVFEMLWPIFESSRTDGVHSFSLHSRVFLFEGTYGDLLFRHHWPELRHLTVSFGPESADNLDELDFEFDFDTWLTKHPLLQHLDITLHPDLAPAAILSELPNLTSVVLTDADPDAVSDFLRRHGHKLISLELPKLVTGDYFSGVPTGSEPTLPRLRVLRCSPTAAGALIQGGHVPQASYVELSPVQLHQGLLLDQWLPLHSSAAKNITCLDIELCRQTLAGPLRDMACTTFIPERFPCLVELSLCSTYFRHADDLYDGCKHLQVILEQLRLLPALRALRIEEMALQPFSTRGPIELETKHAPPRLEYLTWHSPTFNRTQYFRTLRQPLCDTSKAATFAEPPSFLLKLQYMPASFRAHISEDGEWIQPGKLRHHNIILDHTVSPPRLPPQA